LNNIWDVKAFERGCLSLTMKHLQFFKICGIPCRSYESLSKLGALTVQLAGLATGCAFSCIRRQQILLFFYIRIVLSVLECVDHSFDVAHFVFLTDVWIRTQTGEASILSHQSPLVLLFKTFYFIPSKLLTSTGISWKIFFYSIILLGEPPWKKSTRRVKSRSLWFQNQNFDSEVHSVGKKDFLRMSKLPSGLLTSTDTNNVWR